MASVQFLFTAFDRRDQETERQKCRLCEKLAEPPKRFYCSDRCSELFQLALSWPAARYWALKRDNHRCVKCGKIVAGSHHEYNEETKRLVWSEEIANVHHAIPVAYLWTQIRIALGDLEGKERTWRAQQLKSIVFFHLDNLITLCEIPCHKEEHKSGWYEKFRMKETGQKTLVDIFAE